VDASGSVSIASYRRVPQQIVAAAAEHRADAIVLGSHRRRRLARLFSFQVRERTTRLAALPVRSAPSPLEIPKRAGLSMDDLVRSQLEAEPTPRPSSRRQSPPAAR
jgi:hypothetical protein